MGSQLFNAYSIIKIGQKLFQMALDEGSNLKIPERDLYLENIWSIKNLDQFFSILRTYHKNLERKILKLD